MINKNIIIQFFRYLWVAIGIVIILFILSQAIYTKRNLEYNLDFSKTITKDIKSWYPEQRLNNVFELLAEPVYMKIYTPIDFERLTVSGGIFSPAENDIKLGIKQNDGSWDFQQIEIVDDYFSNVFDLTNAQIKNNQLEMILSIPNMTSSARISLKNNWKLILSR
ncbi:MAG: hypothetical protein WCS88_00030 [Patescibacteria group bacterium]|jgi:hypothetical protein